MFELDHCYISATLVHDITSNNQLKKQRQSNNNKGFIGV